VAERRWSVASRRRTLDAMKPPSPEQDRRRLAPGWWTPRSWAAARRVAVDLGLALLVFVATADQGTGMELGFMGVLTREHPAPERTLFAVGLALLVLARRVNPYPLLALAGAAWVVMTAPLGLMVGAYTLAVRPRHPRRDAAILGGLALVMLASLTLDPGVSATSTATILVTILVLGLPALLGLWIGTRRALVASLREKAARLEREQHLKADQAKVHERARIAREMHDVVAHQVSLMVLHAGALEVSLTDTAAAQQASLIRQTGREALEELRQILGVLRDPAGGPLLDPQPTLADLDSVVQQSRDISLEVALVVEGDRRALPATVERTTYRLVQEALTNVHKHAANAATEVNLRYEPARVEVIVRNARPGRPPGADGSVPSGSLPGGSLPGAGHGLLGLRERVTLLGGTFAAGPRLDGGFEVRASIPTEAPTEVPA
jgi:signal transduction histidine kinase